jgi:excisionase family DNA binding protein
MQLTVQLNARAIKLESELAQHGNECLIQRIIELEEQILNSPFCKKALTLAETARYTGLSTSQLYKMTFKGTIPHYKPRGKMIYFNREELDAWMLCNPQGERTCNA